MQSDVVKNILNIAAYKFVDLPVKELVDWRKALKNKASESELKGTILLSEEGINLFLAGTAENIHQFQSFLGQYPLLAGLFYQTTWSETQPFKRLLVKLKKEIISMGYEHIKPARQSAAYLPPTVFKEWLKTGVPMNILDTRNRYEVELGTFQHAKDLKLKHFRHFPRASKQLDYLDKELPLVTFCTGGIRCEKAALWLQQQGFKNVYQLQGGILNYFAECNGEFYQGKCFVFDERVSIEL